MKKGLILIILLVNLLQLSAQNWAPVNTTNKYNYKADTASAISHTLWVDSVTVDGSDSIYYLNRIIKHIGNGYALKNQPQFLQTVIKFSSAGSYQMTGPDTLEYDVNAAVNDNFTYDPNHSITATVVSADTAMVLGETDSIKTWLLSSGDTIIQSKEHGFIQYPMEYGTAKYYRLAGIEGGRNLGEHVMKFDDIFNYAVGDSFWYYTLSHAVEMQSFERHEILTIDTLFSIGDTIWFKLPGQYPAGLCDCIITSPGNDVNSYPNTITPAYAEHVTQVSPLAYFYNVPMAYFYTLESMHFPYESNIHNAQYDYFTSYKAYRQGDYITKLYNRYYSYNTARTDDTLFFQEQAIYDYGLGERRAFSERLGVTDVSIGGFESSMYIKMFAYRLAGDTAWTVIDSSKLTISVEEISMVDMGIKILGNPVYDHISLNLQKGLCDVQLYDLSGRKLLTQTIEAGYNNIDVTRLSSGMYILELSNKETVSRQKIFKL